VDVPPKLSARVRVLSSGNARKNYGLDALATALAASRNERLAAVDPEVGSEALRLLSERREDLVAERTRALNRLHGLLRDLVPGGVTGTLSAHRAAGILRGILLLPRHSPFPRSGRFICTRCWGRWGRDWGCIPLVGRSKSPPLVR
jgi:transposase